MTTLTLKPPSPALLIAETLRRTPAHAAGFARKALQHHRFLRERARQRRMLSTLDDWLLQDIGISREAAQFESRKGFYQD